MTTPTQAAALLRTMKANWVNTEVTDDIAELWTHALIGMDFDHARSAIAQLVEVQPDYWPTVGRLHEVIRSMAPVRPRREIGRGTCGGVGWIEHDDSSSIPCPACNPSLDMIWQDDLLRDRFRSGTPSHVLLPSDFTVTNGIANRTLGMPTPCLPYFEEQIISPAAGKRIAAKAYEVECGLTGRQPNWTYFNRALSKENT